MVNAVPCHGMTSCSSAISYDRHVAGTGRCSRTASRCRREARDMSMARLRCLPLLDRADAIEHARPPVTGPVT